ncbi:hypothetical protein ACLKA7_004681 [Drosophila subpalustris]
MRLILDQKFIAALLVTSLTLSLAIGLRSGAVASNGIGCAEIGGSMLQDGGSAVDAAIATLLCEGIMLPNSMGIGGGFAATIYTRRTGQVETLIAREWAPRAAHRDMFVGQEKVTGAMAVAVPGEILGYWEMHQKYGRLPWKQLFQPTIKMAREGHVVSRFLAAAIKSELTHIQNDPGLSAVFLNDRGEPHVENDYMTRPALAETLERIANNGVGEFYDGGQTGLKFVEDIQRLGGIITLDDLKNFKVRWQNDSDGITKAKVSDGLTLYTTPLPTSGPILAFILNVLSKLYTDDEGIYWQRVVETFKHAYGQRTNLGDYENDPELGASIKKQLDQILGTELVQRVRALIRDDSTSQDYRDYGANFTVEPDHGTANMNVLAPNGDAISITSTINTDFGAKVASMQTGIILNDQMDDFSTPGVINSYGVPSSPANYIYAHKRPMSSMSPAIIVDANGDVRLLVGAAGGTKITTSVASIIIKYLIRHESMGNAMNEGRLHHQLIPMRVDYETDVSSAVVAHLKRAGHLMSVNPGDGGFAAVTAIGALNDEPEPFFDSRRGGSVQVVHLSNKMQH